MLKIIDLVYYSNNDCNTPGEVLTRHRPSLGFVEHIKGKADIKLVKHCNYEGIELFGGVIYAFFKRKNNFFQIPGKTHSYLRKNSADVIIVNGLIFPIQVIALKLLLGKRTILVAQHHGEIPYSGYKAVLQHFADKFITAYIFTSKGNAETWIKQGIIKGSDKCYEVLEASTYLRRSGKEISKTQLGFTGNLNFVWVGRLNENKDPLFILRIFQKYARQNNSARLYMIYQEEDLLDEVISFIQLNQLQQIIILTGKLPNDELSLWYSAADYFLSASRKEGSGYALIEAMACGCIPIVTNIPSYNNLTANGKYGFLYPVGEQEKLLEILSNLEKVDSNLLSMNVEEHFKNELSFEKIANDLLNVVTIEVNKSKSEQY